MNRISFKLTRQWLKIALLLYGLSVVRPLLAQENTSPALWPLAPQGDKSVLVKGVDPTTLVPAIQIGAPQPIPPPDELQQEVATTGPVHGRLLYAPYIKLDAQPESQHFFVMHGVNVTGQVGGRKTAVATYPTRAYNYIWDPLFSPDGRHIVFKNGWPFEGKLYQIYLWDMVSCRLRRITQEKQLVYPYIYWSPDSRKFAYILGGDTAGLPHSDTDHIELIVYDLQTGKTQMIVQDVTVTIIRGLYKLPIVGGTNIAWTPQGTLLYTLQSDMSTIEKKASHKPSTQDSTKSEIKEKTSWPPHPSIFEVSPGGRPEKLIADGYSPLPSPDGKWILFAGWPTTKGINSVTTDTVQNDKAEESTLYLFERTSKKVTQINLPLLLQLPRVGVNVGNLMQWAPNSKSLIAVLPKYAAGAPSEGRVVELDIATKNLRDVAVLQAKPSAAQPKPAPYVFRSLEISKDGSFAIVDITQFLGTDGVVDNEKKTLLAVSLRDGRIFPVASVDNKSASVLGWDWHDESTPATSATPATAATTP